MKVKYPSLELNWLKFPKDISIPDIITVGVDDFNYGGCYYEPEWNSISVSDRSFSLERGLLVVREDNYESTLVHEFRHHVQRVHFGIKPDGIEWEEGESYKNSIIKYFTSSVTEMDALLYELKHYPDDVNLEWYEWLVKHYENNKV